MNTQCTLGSLQFHPLGRRCVTGRFDGGRISSDTGGMLLREVDQRIGLTARMEECFTDYRNLNSVEHQVVELLIQRIYAIALGYEDLNDHDALRDDPVLPVLVGKQDLLGKARVRQRDRNHALASASTLNRFELGEPQEAPQSRYKRIVADPEKLDKLLMDAFMESYDQAPQEIWLDLDATDDLVHGQQEGRFFHGYYGGYCYLPLYIFCGQHLLCARLRTANRDGADGCLEELSRIVSQIRKHWPKTRIHIRGDSGFCRESILRWCEDNAVEYVLGLARNQRLVRALGAEMEAARRLHRHTGEASRRYRDFRYRTCKSWSRSRRVVGKAEVLAKGDNPRFVVTSLTPRRVAAKQLYERLYCARGDMENRIKEQQLDLFADRTSSHTMRANQLRLYFSSFAYVLMQGLRRLGVQGTSLARAQCCTLRLKLLKVGARVRITARRVWLSFSESWPHAETFAEVLENLRAQPVWDPPG